jgi:PTEN phosphatase family protein
LATRHYGKFRVFNLCQAFEESGNGNYDNKLLYDQVQKIPLRDHDVPPLYILIHFCEMATVWLNKDEENLAAIHCRGGKGRTGTFCCALLLWLGIVNTAENAMNLFASRRTLKRKGMLHNALQGVSAPCQRRYLFYMEEIVYHARDWFSPRLVLLTNVRMMTMPLFRQEFVSMFVPEIRL